MSECKKKHQSGPIPMPPCNNWFDPMECEEDSEELCSDCLKEYCLPCLEKHCCCKDPK